MVMKEFYGDDVRWFVGIVEDIRDPLDLGRLRVRIYGIHSASKQDIGTGELPWASVVAPITQPGVSGLHQPYGIKPGAQVFGIFMDGKASQIPLVFGSIPRREDLTVPGTEEDSKFVPIDNPQNRSGKTNREPRYEKKPIPIVAGGNEEKAFNFIKSYFETQNAQYAGEIAAGFVGNLLHEAGAGLDPTTPEEQPIAGRGGIGIAQWTGPRRVFLENEFSQNIEPPTSPLDFETQLQYITWELENTHRHVKNRLLKAKTVAEAAEIVLRYYETPAVAVDYNLLVQDKPPIIQKILSAEEIAEVYQAEANERIKDSRFIFDEMMVKTA